MEEKIALPPFGGTFGETGSGKNHFSGRSGSVRLRNSPLSTRSPYHLYSFSGVRHVCHDNDGRFVYGSRYIGDKHLATQHTNKLSHVLCSGQRSAALQLSRSTHESHRSRRRSRRASLSNLWPPCQVYSDQRVEQRPCGKEVSTWLPSWQSCSLSVSFSFWPGHSVFLFSFSFGFEGIFPEVYRQWFSLATAVGLLCDDYWTGCVDGRHIISSRAMSEDNERCRWQR